ncbi:MAG: hypothetical protein IJH08_03485 [Atopobiaceae bacterium]|nr:hypothetical protein [Atopobiaceae bacterium]
MKKVANLLFPADYFDKRSPDGAMRAEYEAAVAEGRLDVSLFDLELFDERGRASLARPFLDPGLPLIYRGWMMKPGEYGSFHRALVGLGLRPITSPEAYAEFHMFPLAYERHEALRSSSPGLLAFPGTGADADAVNGRFERFMVKDYVKSVKGTSVPASVRTPISQGDLDALVAEFVRLRGGLFTEGIVLKEVVDLRRYGPNLKAPASYAQSTQGDFVYVWRLYDKGRTGDHIYLVYGTEMKQYLADGWVVDKGAGFWTLRKGATINGRTTIPIYRAYNYRLGRGKHHYTPSKVEYDSICKNNGWKPEGVKFYVIKK